MTNLLRKERVQVITAGGTSAAYGVGYSEKPVIGEIVRIDLSGAGLGGSGFFTLKESGAIIPNFIGGSALDAGEINWNNSFVPMISAVRGNDASVSMIGGSAFATYFGNGIAQLTVSGCNAGSLFADIHYRDMRG